jgi:hypothetical protein
MIYYVLEFLMFMLLLTYMVFGIVIAEDIIDGI